MLRVQLVVGERGGRFPFSNSFLVKTSGPTVLVDAGAGGALADLAGRVDVVVVTHYHPDHIRGLGLLQSRRVYAPALDTRYKGLAELAKRFAPAVWDTWYRMARGLGVPEELPEAQPYEEGDVVYGLEPVWLPGHLRSHHGFVAGDALIGADMDLTGFGPWYGNPESSLEGVFLDACRLLELRPRTYYSSHLAEPVPGDRLAEELSRYLGRVLSHAEKTLSILEAEGPLRLEALVGRGIVYPRYPGSGYTQLYRFFESMMLLKLLEYLAANGLVAAGRRGYRAVSGWRERLKGLRERLTGYLASCTTG